MQGTDIEGATWYRWLNVNNSWNDQQKFWGLDFNWNLGIYTFNNFYDNLIIQLAKYFEFNYSVIFFSNLVLVITIVLNMIATYYFAKIFTQSQVLAFVVTTFFVLNTQNLLTMRVPINNNSYFAAITALTLFIRCTQNSIHPYWKIPVFLLYCLQININIYNLMPIFLLHLAYMAIKFDSKRPLKSVFGILAWLLFMLLAVLINFRDSITLITRNSTSEALRPVEWVDEIVATNRIWSTNPSGNQFTFLIIVMFLLGLRHLIQSRKLIDKDRLALIYASLLTLVILLLLVFDIGRNAGVQWIYQQIFWQFRGVNYFWKFNTFLLLPLLVTYLGSLKSWSTNFGSIKSLFAPDFPNRKKKLRKAKESTIPLNVFLSFLLIINLFILSPHKDLSAQRGDLKQFEKGLQALTSRVDGGLTLELPNRLRGVDSGFPEGYIQLSQIIHQHPLLNGIPEISEVPIGPPSTQNILNIDSIQDWSDRGVKYLIVRPRLLSNEEKSKWLALSQSGTESLKLLGSQFKRLAEPDYMELQIYEIVAP
jgi:hypothetical protein